MKLNISDLLKHRKDKLPFEIFSDSIFIEREDFKLVLMKPLKVIGEALYDNEVIGVKGKILAEMEAQCSRCLNGFIQPVIIDFDERFSKLQTDEEVYPVQEEYIDLEDMVIDNLILSIPTKPLCSEECKGLCANCGANLNDSECDCEKDNIDPRFAALKDLFKR